MRGTRALCAAIGAGLGLAAATALGQQAAADRAALRLLLRWSPDGRRLLYTAYAPDFNVELWVLPTDGSGGARRLTRTAQEEVAGVWSLDGRRIAVVRENSVSESVFYEIALLTRIGRRVGTVARSSLRDAELTRPPRLSWRPLPR